jgi:hypothetical protein
LSRRGGRRATQNLNRSREQLVAFVLRRTAAAAPPVANNLALLRVDHWQRRGQRSPAGPDRVCGNHRLDIGGLVGRLWPHRSPGGIVSARSPTRRVPLDGSQDMPGVPVAS